MKKLTDHQKRMIALGIACVLVLYGLAQAIFKLDWYTKYRSITDEVSFLLFVTAAALLFSINRKPKPEEKQEPAETEKPEETKSE